MEIVIFFTERSSARYWFHLRRDVADRNAGDRSASAATFGNAILSPYSQLQHPGLSQTNLSQYYESRLVYNKVGRSSASPHHYSENVD